MKISKEEVVTQKFNLELSVEELQLIYAAIGSISGSGVHHVMYGELSSFLAKNQIQRKRFLVGILSNLGNA